MTATNDSPMTGPDGRGLASCLACCKAVVAIDGGPGEPPRLVDPAIGERWALWARFPDAPLSFWYLGQHYPTPHDCRAMEHPRNGPGQAGG